MKASIAQQRHYNRRLMARLTILAALLAACLGSGPVAGKPGATPPGEPDQPRPAAGFAPFLDIVPSSNGSDVFITAGGIDQLAGRLFANVGIGPGGRRGSYTMTYSQSLEIYVATATGFDPQVGSSGTIDITSTTGLASEVLSFQRAYVPFDPNEPLTEVVAEDGNLRLAWASRETLPFDTYIVIAPSFAPPGPPPPGHRLVGGSYSVRAADALVTSERPMLLTMNYNAGLLAGAAPQNLAIFAWDAAARSWQNLGGELFGAALSVNTSRFTTYALMAAPAWRDAFNDRRGLESASTVRLNGLAGTLELSPTLSSGIALSLPISPTAAIAHWGILSYSAGSAPPTSTLRIDLLSLDGAVLRSDLPSGSDLADLDPAIYPVLRLRARLDSQSPGLTPALDAWQLTWLVRPAREEWRIFLPLTRSTQEIGARAGGLRNQ